MIKHPFAVPVFGAAAIAALAFAPAAQADLGDYLAFLQSHGVTITSNDSVEQQGIQVCEGLKSGASQGQEIGLLEQRMGRAEAEDIVVAAHQYICPG